MSPEQKLEIVRLILEYSLARSPNANGDPIFPDSVLRALALLFPNGV